MTAANWENDGIQFPRLLAELQAAGVEDLDMVGLCESMDLTAAQVHELFDRAQRTWERIVAHTPGGPFPRLTWDPEPCDQCMAEPIPGVLTGMNWTGDPTGGVQACGNCAQYPGDLDAALALAKHLGRDAWFVRHDHTTGGHTITKVTDDIVAAEEDGTWSIAERTDPWVGEWDDAGYHLTDQGNPDIIHPPKEQP